MLDRFRGAGAGSKVDSWVGTGPNEPIQPSEVEAAIDEDTLTSLSMQTGLSREELISRITRDLPEAVSKMTPTGELPVEAPVEAAIDEDTLTSLSMQTGLSREELISRITRDLPEAVSKMTPTGELPVEAPKSSGETTLLDDVPSHRTQANSGGQSDI
nr:YidB family protein [Mesorhizobium sp. LSJC265A00]